MRSLGIDGISSIDSALTAGTGALYCEVIVVEFQSSEQARAYLERLADERADNGKVEPLPPPALADDAVVHRGADGTPGFVTMRRGPVVVVMNLRQWRALDPVAVATELARAIDGRLAALVPSDADIVA